MSLMRPSSLSFAALESVRGGTGELDCVLCNLAVTFWKGPQHTQHVQFIKCITAIPDQCISVAFSDKIPGCPETAGKLNGFKVFFVFFFSSFFLVLIFWPQCLTAWDRVS